MQEKETETKPKINSGEVTDQNIDFEALSKTIGHLTKNYDRLPISKQLSLINLILKVSITRDGSKLVIPTMEQA
ncbi:MAG TPA: hypothetical protein VMX17_08985 [Candidatus Glassbacteria bacterium]|nr:hypothetical protein [Candidatus Glassbacteria bacterium]